MPTYEVEYENAEGENITDSIVDEDEESVVTDLETSGCRVISIMEN